MAVNPPVDTASFQLGVPPDYDDAAELEEEASWLRDLADKALAYMSSFSFAPPITDMLMAFGVGEVIGLFLVRFAHAIPGAEEGENEDREVWVVVGDLPSMFFATEPRNPADALRLYCVIANDWAERVLAGGDLSEAFPIEAAPTRGNAEVLKSRIGAIQKLFIPIAGSPARIAAKPI